ncbi:DNA-binding protein [Capilliphycus salinus ALCB114379]|uniref:DNA-binding protein n=1 Tax=Capilliphycus salinus TaxID=2768948 RepID=UPI0039A77900
MIKTQQEYQFTRQLVKEFEQSIAALEQDETRRSHDPNGWELMKVSLLSQLEKLKSEVAEYYSLISYDSFTPIVLTLSEIENLPQILVKARMAAKLSPKELADLAGLTEEKIKHYEDNDYEDASFLEVKFVMNALDIQVQKGEFLVPLDTLRRTPVTQNELLSSSHSS